ncbi:hypothetical protein PTSG_05623 [Salpingoeca rosetta]|uniref:SAM domain-containing protein n=1 Tax=Salpingoeca rosetta (strain ATCC 50818 / BSB-021) TaxID=946362 RepID=F2UBR1_SALR5|nr:uncharacterized protein PTSG_05623 [Salpingoeca rosetta]EGD73927.1 hypothetical protein PTSG_05623 [Salpingoeca rosetta]|eukprot:XP_004993490.1 hypothetical protein PTSG_05623 [Salpingoeca rosetta]
MDDWSHEDVVVWLTHLKLQNDVVDVFKAYEVTGRDLSVLSDEELAAMGISNKLARLRITVKRQLHLHAKDPRNLPDESLVPGQDYVMTPVPAPPPRHLHSQASVDDDEDDYMVPRDKAASLCLRGSPDLSARKTNEQRSGMRPRAATVGMQRAALRRPVTAPSGRVLDMAVGRQHHRHPPTSTPRQRNTLSRSTDAALTPAVTSAHAHAHARMGARRMTAGAGVVTAAAAARKRTSYDHIPHVPTAVAPNNGMPSKSLPLPPFQQELRDSLVHQIQQARKRGTNEMANIVYTRTRLDTDLCQQLSKELRMCQLVSTVILDRCGLTNETVHYVAMAIPHHSGLRKLSLEHNKIKDDGAIVIAQALRRNASLKQLNLAHNKIGTKGATELINATRYVFGFGEYNLSLSEVNIASNSFSKKKIGALLKDDTEHDTSFNY